MDGSDDVTSTDEGSSDVLVEGFDDGSEDGFADGCWDRTEDGLELLPQPE
jgi:hypothetical protein